LKIPFYLKFFLKQNLEGLISSTIESFPTTPRVLSKFSIIFSFHLNYFFVKKLFNIQKLLHHRSQHYETNLVQPYTSSAFQQYQEHGNQCLFVLYFWTKFRQISTSEIWFGPIHRIFHEKKWPKFARFRKNLIPDRQIFMIKFQ
jgi:hypothetical protein